MIRLTDKNSHSLVKEINIETDGVSTPIKKVLVYNTDLDTTDEVFPESCANIRIETNYDPLSLTARAVPGKQYPAPVINPVSEGFVPLTVTVTPYPPNAGWFLSSPTGFNVPSTVYYGTQTIPLTIETPEVVGYNYHEILANPIKGNNLERGSNLFYFYIVKFSESSVVYDYDWRFNESLIDNIKTAELINVNQAVNGYTATYANGYDDKALKAVYNVNYTADPCRYRTNINLPNWKTTGISISYYGYPGVGGHMGFHDLTTSDSYAANDLKISTQYRLPSNGTLKNNIMVPLAPVTDRQEPYPKLCHVAVVLSPIDIYNHPNIVVESTDPENPEAWRVTYTSPNVQSSPGVAYTSVTNYTVSNKLSARTFFLVTRYLNGIIKAEDFAPLETATMTQPGNGNFEVYFVHNAEQYSMADILDRITVYSGVLTAGDIAAELSTVGLTAASYTPPIKNEARAQDRITVTPSTVPITPVLKPFIIDDRTIAVAGGFRDWFIERLDIEYVNYGATEENYRNGFTQLWQLILSNTQIVQMLYKDYQPLIVAGWDAGANFRVNNNPITLIGRWSTAVSLMRFPDRFDGTKSTYIEVADIAQYAYLRLATPMVEGQTYNVSWVNNGVTTTTSLTYSRSHYASSIKVNQEGYLAEVNKKYAYVGCWLGILVGSTDRKYDPTQNPNFNGTFDVYPVGSDTSVFTGSLVLRSGLTETFDPGIGLTLNITGENVYRMDFSEVTTEGNYQIYVPGIGWSHEFTIGINAIAKPFYYSARAFFHHRGACDDVREPYTKWEYGAHGKIAWQSDFPADEYTFNLIKTSSGVEYPSIFPRKQFELIGNNVTGKIFRDATGGWFDAADFDRRPMHMQCAKDMIDLYIYNTAAFTDNQLDLPESGNGIPDILSEAEWGIDIWRRAQAEDGGITMWQEATFHEAGFSWEVPTKYHLASYNRADSLNYANGAAKFARALKMVGTDLALKKSAIFAESAIRAFNFGIDDSKTLHLSFTQVKNDTAYEFEYTESETAYLKAMLPAAASLFMLTKDPRFATYINDNTFQWYFYDSLASNETTYGADLVPEMLLDLADYFPKYCKILQDHIVAKAVVWRAKQEEHPYYAINWSTKTDYKYFYNFVGYGAGQPDRRGRFYVYAWLITGDIAWRDQAAMSMDFALGCNPLGRTLTTGLGKVAPVRYLDGWMAEAEVRYGYYDGIPGISPYWITAQASYASGFTGVTKFVYRLTATARDWFPGVTLNLLPGGYSATIGNIQNTVGEFIFKNLPMWRQACEIEALLPMTTEYTIWETMGPKLWMWGMLMNEPYVPDPSWHLRAPSTNLNNIEGYLFLP